jgi:hypothetical protein
LREVQGLDGVMYSFMSVLRSPSGRRLRGETLYGIIHGGREFRLVFIVPLERKYQKDQYHFLFDQMAKTFDVDEWNGVAA